MRTKAQGHGARFYRIPFQHTPTKRSKDENQGNNSYPDLCSGNHAERMRTAAQGRKHDKNFIENNIQADDYTVMFTKLDSTRHVSDKAIQAMRANAENNGTFKKGIKYGKAGEQYLYIKTKICLGNDTLDKTFYLEPSLTEVVAFK